MKLQSWSVHERPKTPQPEMETWYGKEWNWKTLGRVRLDNFPASSSNPATPRPTFYCVDFSSRFHLSWWNNGDIFEGDEDMTLSDEYFAQLYQEAERRLERVDHLLIEAEKQHIKASEQDVPKPW